MLHIGERSLWLLVGGSIACVLLSGIVCYYAGYYVASREFHSYYIADSLNDRLTASLYTLYGDIGTEAAVDDSESESEAESAEVVPSEEDNSPNQTDVMSKQERESEQVSAGEAFDVIDSPENILLYDAYLIGFGAKRSADRYVARLSEQNINAHVLVRENKNSRGKKIMWYQVAIGPLPYHQLLEVVELLKYRDKLEGVVFVEHKS